MTSNRIKIRLKEFDEVLQCEEIDLKTLRSLCFHGIPDEGNYRSICWRLLLGLLVPKKSEWDSILRKKRELYQQFIDEMIVPPGQLPSADHPLNANPESAWGAYFRDNEVLLQIDKDVRRLCPDISFFQQATEYPCGLAVNGRGERRLHNRVAPEGLKSANVERKGLGASKITLTVKRATEDYQAMAEGQEAHWEVVQRILFIYAKLNPGQGYVQGMNEIIGPIYHVLASASDPIHREFAEADTFFCFTHLMSEIRDFFIKTLDETIGGIKAMMSKVNEELKVEDFDVWQLLKSQQLFPQYYSFRWITLLLSQEFPLPDVVRIWDTLFADEKRFDFLVHICCAMIITLRDQIICSDFASNVKLLQNFPPIDIQVILNKAAILAKKYI
ncbi:TBC1 domain family member 13 [Ctenocephalides felis]|uniref:TBC1 domain family member 13 n=1 Tax=Ctenocephalides felis TaxID=7515 RepID=UPI000E6E5AB2|nr:TBC1 domain family member 13 [Ctenocephalides felis]